MTRRNCTLPLIILISIFLASIVKAQHKGINFQAVIRKPDGALLNLNGIKVAVQILDPVNNCILREEEHDGVNINNGYLNLVLGGASASTPAGKNPTSVLSLNETLNNQVSRTGLTCVDIQNNIIATNQTYVPSNLDRRIARIRINFDNENVAADFNIRAVGFAVNSEMLNSKTDSDLINVNGAKGVTQENLENIFEQQTKLNALLGKSDVSGNDLSVNINGNAATATTAASIVGGVNTLLPAQSGNSGKYLTTDGTNVSWVPVVSSGGTITGVMAGSGLVGGGTTGNVTLGLNDVGAAGTYTKVTTDAQGRVTAGTNLGAADIPALDAAKISTGNFSDSMFSGLGIEKLNNEALKYFSYKPSNTPCADDEVLKYDSTLDTGNGGWRCALDNNLTPPSDASYLAKGVVQFNNNVLSSGISITGGVVSLNTGTLAQQIVKLDGGGKLPALDGSQLTNLPTPAGFTGSFAGDVSGSQGLTSVDKIKGQVVTATGSIAGQVFRFAGGNNWTPGFVAMTDLRSTVTGANAFPSSCNANQTLTFNSVGDSMACQNISVAKYQISDFPNLAAVATSGSYSDLISKPTIPAAQVKSDWNAVSGVAQILSKPTLGTLALKSSVTSAELASSAVGTTELADNSVNNIKIVGLSASKLTGIVPKGRLRKAENNSGGIVTDNSQEFKGTKTFLNGIVMQGALVGMGLLTANGGVTTTTVAASAEGQFDRIKIAGGSATCDVSSPGVLRYNSVIKSMEYCDGSSWLTIDYDDPCLVGSPAIGTVCKGGSIYLGVFDGGKYMVTPSGCTNSATPTCAGGTDTVTKFWNDGSANNFDIPGVEDVGLASTKSSSSYRGNVNTDAITAITSTEQGGIHQAAKYCQDMVYGGYDDWYLPSKSELAYMYCKATPTVEHNALYPQEDPNCVGYGGKQSILTGFKTTYYWSSSQYFDFAAHIESFSQGHQGVGGKSDANAVRCLRRY